MNPQDLWKWPAREFYTQQLYLAHKSKCQSEYSKLLMKRK